LPPLDLSWLVQLPDIVPRSWLLSTLKISPCLSSPDPDLWKQSTSYRVVPFLGPVGTQVLTQWPSQLFTVRLSSVQHPRCPPFPFPAVRVLTPRGLFRLFSSVPSLFPPYLFFLSSSCWFFQKTNYRVFKCPHDPCNEWVFFFFELFLIVSLFPPRFSHPPASTIFSFGYYGLPTCSLFPQYYGCSSFTLPPLFFSAM